MEPATFCVAGREFLQTEFCNEENERQLELGICNSRSLENSQDWEGRGLSSLRGTFRTDLASNFLYSGKKILKTGLCNKENEAP